MRGFGKLSSVFGIAIFAAAGVAAPAWAQPQRSWVSGTGDDGNPCTRTLPCRTFSRAQAQTGSRGEINCLSAGDFDSVTITKSITIDCAGLPGGLTAGYTGVGIDGIVVNGSGINVVIRGLSILGDVGAGSNSSYHGIDFQNGESLVVDNVVIRGHLLGNDGSGIRFAPGTAARLHVINTLITDNGRRAGIQVDPSGGGYANVTLEDVRLIGNRGAALLVNVTGNTGSSTNVIVSRSAFTSSSENGVSVIAPAGTAGASVTIADSIVSNNVVNGLLATGPAAQILVSNTTIAGNSNGVLASGGASIGSYGNNRLVRNGTNGAFTAVISGN